jgi:NAD(P)H-hydrate epimerase
MATAGSGDVLAGVIGGMVAQGAGEPWTAAMAGVLAHALAGDRAAAEIGERGMLASDITLQLPAVLNPPA